MLNGECLYLKKLVLSLAVIFLVLAGGCQQQASKPAESKKEQPIVNNQGNPTAIIEMADGKKIELELNAEKAPNTVANFVTLAESGFYNNLTFHRVISGFMIQGGDPKGNGTGGPDYTIKGEFSENGFQQNNLKHERGVISMARKGDPNSAGSQFFIMHQTNDQLDGKYAAFGKVISGIEVVDQIASVAVDAKDKPEQAQVIKKITIDKKGGTFTVEKQK
ncbi:MAG: peptidylprolyl isomerase [Culicoidibacterales bacterium]